MRTLLKGKGRTLALILSIFAVVAFVACEGPEGPAGARGADGSAGSTGSAGPAGSGSDGSDGATGSSGSDGSDGAAGPPGQPGIDGSDGSRGSTGRAGADGVSPAADLVASAASGGNATVWGSGFESGETISLLIGGFSSPVGRATANNSGAFSATISVNVADGVYTLWAEPSRGRRRSPRDRPLVPQLRLQSRDFGSPCLRG